MSKRGTGQQAVFLSTFEKQLDAKRRIVLPHEFRAAAASADGTVDRVYCLQSIESDCIVGGGYDLVVKYTAVIEEIPEGDPLRYALKTSLYPGFTPLGYDTAGRITLPQDLCEKYGLTDWVSVVGMGDRFEIWPREAFRAHRERALLAVREGLPAFRAQQRAQRTADAA